MEAFRLIILIYVEGTCDASATDQMIAYTRNCILNFYFIFTYEFIGIQKKKELKKIKIDSARSPFVPKFV